MDYGKRAWCSQEARARLATKREVGQAGKTVTLFVLVLVLVLVLEIKTKIEDEDEDE